MVPIVGLLLAACAAPVPGAAPVTPAPTAAFDPGPVPASPIGLAGWKLTLPIAGPKGTPKSVEPADVAPPYLTRDADGRLLFWAPVAGTTTANSEHTRTELNSLSPFTAGQGRHTLSATVSVTQVPEADPDVIIGQIHGTGPISAVSFVMLHYDSGVIRVVVKQQRSGSSSEDHRLLEDVPLGAPFTYSITDDGDGTLHFSATQGGRTGDASAPIPTAFTAAPVRFQAGAYQQADSTADSASPDDGARVTFSALTTVG